MSKKSVRGKRCCVGKSVVSVNKGIGGRFPGRKGSAHVPGKNIAAQGMLLIEDVKGCEAVM